MTGFGTGGTLKGVGRVLKKERPDTKIVLCEPDNAQLIAGGIAQERNDDGWELRIDARRYQPEFGEFGEGDSKTLQLNRS